MKYASSKRKKLLVLMLVVTISALTIISVLLRNVLFTSLEGIETWISLLSIVGLIVTIVIAIAELRNSKEISRATFIVGLNQTFIENEQYKKLYDLMQSCIDKKCSYATNGLFYSNGCKIGVDKSIISYYLKFLKHCIYFIKEM